MPEVSVKQRATTLLRRYDALRLELRTVERELSVAVVDYARDTGRWALSRDHFRSELEREEQLEQAAERNDWEKAHA